MKLKILKTGSQGNCYILEEDDGRCHIIEAGARSKEIIRALNYDSSKAHSLLISHKHDDHARWASEIGLTLFADPDVTIPGGKFREGDTFRHVGYFQVHHDVETMGFYIDSDSGTVVYCSDMRQMPYQFNKAEHFIVECNYSEEILEANVQDGTVHNTLANRIRESHMSLERLIRYFERLDNTHIRTITLIHLSDQNSDELLFKLKLQEATGAVVNVADNGSVFEL